MGGEVMTRSLLLLSLSGNPASEALGRKRRERADAIDRARGSTDLSAAFGDGGPSHWRRVSVDGMDACCCTVSCKVMMRGCSVQWSENYSRSA